MLTEEEFDNILSTSGTRLLVDAAKKEINEYILSKDGTGLDLDTIEKVAVGLFFKYYPPKNWYFSGKCNNCELGCSYSCSSKCSNSYMTCFRHMCDNCNDKIKWIRSTKEEKQKFLDIAVKIINDFENEEFTFEEYWNINSRNPWIKKYVDLIQDLRQNIIHLNSYRFKQVLLSKRIKIDF
jgi:hypothetical protein